MAGHRAAPAPADRRRSDHVCLAFRDRAEFLAAASAFLTAGAAAGERLMYVSGRSRAAMLDDLAGDDALRALLATGAVSVVQLDEIYGSGTVRWPVDEQLRVYSRATDDALAAGFTGLRVAAEATDLALGAQDELARWEHLADELIAGSALSALCGYDHGVVPAATLADIAATHPVVHGHDDLAPFRLYVVDGRLTLAGVLDAFGADRAARLLRASHVAATGSAVRLDLADLAFVDARGAYTLMRWGLELAGQGRRLVLVDASEMLARIWRALRFDDVATIELRRGTT
jgi:anti-anti-sigma regulatory factor